MVDPVVYRVEHVSRYRYLAPIRSCALTLCLKPLQDDSQQLLAFELTTFPVSLPTAETDSFGNTKHLLNIHQSTDLVEVISRSTISLISPPRIADSVASGSWDAIRSLERSFGHWEFLNDSAFARTSDALCAFVDEVGIRPQDDPFQSLLGLSETLHDSFQYVPGSTTVISPIEHILEWRQGVCQDYAHVMIAIVRDWGIPARYVSGYLYVKAHDHDSASGVASHAWVECLLPGWGWVGFDPTNQCVTGQGHIRVGIGRDYQDVAPIRGIFTGGSGSDLTVEVRVRAAS